MLIQLHDEINCVIMAAPTPELIRQTMAGRKTFLNERLTYRLNVLAEQAIAANDAIFVRETGCKIRELRVLRLIDDSPGTTFRDIATASGLERSLTSRLIQGLIANKLIERENSETDARVFRLTTTKRGKEVRAVAREVSDRLEAILTTPLSEDELVTMNELIDRLAVWVASDDYSSALKSED